MVTGIGLVSSLGIGTTSTWHALLAGQSGVGPITKFDASTFPVRFAAELKGFDPSQYMDRKEIAERWFNDEYVPVVAMLKEADLIGSNTETEAYVKVGSLRYLLLRTHDWDEEIIERIRDELSRPAGGEADTLENMMRGGLGD